MELEEDEAQVCRLCGQCESIYIDVFGEEGTKRFLGFKIHSKINIVIDERDPLPKAICVQCLGKLEFVCDFQEECLRTQQLLRDQYNPPLSDIEENKVEDLAPSTSASTENKTINDKGNINRSNINNDSTIDTKINNNVNNNNNNNNNNSDKNLNPPENEIIKDESRSTRNTTKSQRNLRSQQNQVKSNIKKDSLELQLSNNDDDMLASIQQPEITTTTRRLRSRQSIEVLEAETNSKNSKRACITKKKLRSHNNTVDSTTNSKANASTINQNSGGKNYQVDHNNKIQIPTNTLNKVLSAITNAPGIGVSVKESTNRNGDAEDISFTVELCKKQETDSLTVLAKVFPDQGSCLVDKSIVTFLEDGTNEEVNNLVNNIVSPNTSKDGSDSLIDKLQNAEDITNSSRNPEELFKMDGEEIHVDEKVEQVNVNNQVSYACKLCRKVYERKDKCTVHVKTHLGIKQYMCILCQAKFVCKSDVMKHIRCSHTNPRPISCPKCPKRFRSKFDLAEHNNVHKGVRPYQCADCDQSYHHKVSLQMHVKSHMPPQNLACEYCGKVFPYRTRLLSHIGSVHMKDRRNFRCRFCYNLYSSLSVLNEHIKTRHTTTYTCETCSKTFKVASKYKAHVLQHSNPKPFVCDICKNRYASKAFLNEHVLKHQGVRKHVCQKCGAAFAQASHLAAHRHVHGEKSHACPECGKMFNRRDNMKVHRRRHLIPGGKKTNIKHKNISNNENRIISNEKIKPDDGLPQIICMRCLGTLEFLCDFHNMCHSTQKDLESTVAVVTDKEPKDKLESDPESDKENVLPCKFGKRKVKLLQLEQIKLLKSVESDENVVIQKTEISNEQSTDKTNNTVTLFSAPNNNKHIEMTPENLNANTCYKSNGQNETEIILDRASKTIISQTNKTSDSNDSIVEIVTKNSFRQSRSLKLEKKKNKISKTSPITIKSKKNENKMLNKRVDKCTVQCEKNVKNANEKNRISDETNVASKSSVNEHVDQEKVIFEGTVINSTGDTSIIMPLKAESCGNELRLDNVIMAEGSEIVQAQEIVWISNNFELREPEKPKSVNSNQSKIISPALGDEAETMETDGTLVIPSGQHMKLTTSTEQLIVLEVQLPAKEHSITLPNATEAFRRKRSSSTTSSEYRYSEGKFAKISELMTDKQKRDIETHYLIDMTLVDQSKVDKNIITLEKCKFKCKICEMIYPRLDKCQVHIWRHLDMKPYICKACDFSTLTVSNIRCHIRKSHLKIKPFQCHLCNKRYNSATLLEEHINIHIGLRPYQCNFCKFASTSKQVLAHHILIHKSKKDIICDICEKAFYSKGRMRAHKITHNKDQAFKCTLCSTYVLHEEALERHYMNVHTQDYVCKICSKIYKSRKALHNHESVHSDAKFECPMCPNVYKSTHILKEHILKHQGIRQYKCNSCHKSFAQQSHLAAHMAVHSDITYNCPGCQKGFNRHDNMKVHTKRCEKFLANPELQHLLTKRKISFSKNHTAKVNSQKGNNNLNERKKNRKKLKNCSKKTAFERPVIVDIELNDNIGIVKNVLIA